MAKIKCEKCGHEIEINEAQLSTYQESVDKAVKAKELELRKSISNELNLKQNEEIAKLKQELLNTKNTLKDLEHDKEIEFNKAIAEKEKEITKLKSDIKIAEKDNESNIKDAVNEKEKEILKLKNEIKLKDADKEREIKSLTENYKFQIKERDETIEKIKDYKDKLSVKALGEELEQHCLCEFNKNRVSMFPSCEFHKDNKVSNESGSKGDFIFRDFFEGQEYISIMLEMKNEKDQTKTKQKNEDFFKELDKDRREKNCEYAILVSELEPNSEFYNEGIVDVSFAYEKMFVVRPRCFITLIGLLTNAAKKTIKTRQELEIIKQQNIGIVDFEAKLSKAKENLGISLSRAASNFDEAIKNIDKSIKDLQNTKDKLLKSIDALNTTQGKLDDITIRKLTYGNQVMQEKFAELKKQDKKKEADIKEENEN